MHTEIESEKTKIKIAIKLRVFGRLRWCGDDAGEVDKAFAGRSRRSAKAKRRNTPCEERPHKSLTTRLLIVRKYGVILVHLSCKLKTKRPLSKRRCRLRHARRLPGAPYLRPVRQLPFPWTDFHRAFHWNDCRKNMDRSAQGIRNCRSSLADVDRPLWTSLLASLHQANPPLSKLYFENNEYCQKCVDTQKVWKC